MTRADGVMATANNNLLKSKYTFTSTQLKKKKNLFFTNTHILNHDHFTVLYFANVTSIHVAKYTQATKQKKQQQRMTAADSDDMELMYENSLYTVFDH